MGVTFSSLKKTEKAVSLHIMCFTILRAYLLLKEIIRIPFITFGGIAFHNHVFLQRYRKVLLLNVHNLEIIHAATRIKSSTSQSTSNRSPNGLSMVWLSKNT